MSYHQFKKWLLLREAKQLDEPMGQYDDVGRWVPNLDAQRNAWLQDNKHGKAHRSLARATGDSGIGAYTIEYPQRGDEMVFVFPDGEERGVVRNSDQSGTVEVQLSGNNVMKFNFKKEYKKGHIEVITPREGRGGKAIFKYVGK